MKLGIRAFLIAVLACLTFQSAWAAESELVDTGKVNAQLVSTHDAVAPGQDFYIALRTVLDLHWHTYWYNPGDSGEPVQITWSVPDGVNYDDIVWPLPEPIATGPIINYGFEDVPFFPVKFNVPDTALPGDVLQIDADVYYLVCKDVCIPEDTQLQIDIRVGEPEMDARWSAAIERALIDAPGPGDAEAGLVQMSDRLRLSVTGLEGMDVSEAYYFPFDQGVINHSAPQVVTEGPTGFAIDLEPGFDWDSGQPSSAVGLIRYKQGGKFTGELIDVRLGEELATGVVAVPSSRASGSGSPIGFWAAVFGALIGGLILNLMPCVFPVISIKALSIAKTAHGERGTIRRQAWAYTAGILVTFWILTALLLILKAGGAEIGWGFQLQNPPLVAGLAIVLFLVGLNLLGVFEIGTRFQNVGGGLTEKTGSAGSFFTGVLAVIVATPCTAPFMAGAIGYALTASALSTIAVFTALAIGFALPFLLIAYVPGLMNRLPKPGPWMARFKEFLAFPMFAASVWLVWVLSLQAGDRGVVAVLSAMLAFAFAIWLGKRSTAWTKVLAAICVIGALAVPLSLRSAHASVEIEVIEWSPATVASLRAEGRPVFVDFTAAWCVTCKVNERLVLETDAVKQAFADTNTAFVIADWTNQNDEIARELESHGRSGVPLYLLYPPGNNPVSPEILPQVLTKDMLISKLEGLK